MANRENGEVSIQVGDKTYTMALTLDAMVALEDMFSTPQKVVTFQDVAEAADRGSVKHLRAMLWAVLQLHHPELTIKEISPLVQAAGGIRKMQSKFIELGKASTADPLDLDALGIATGKNPPPAQATKKATNGTGGGSISAPGARA